MKNRQNEPYGEILALARALNGLHEQSCSMLKPIVDDYCKHPEFVDEKELEHVFDVSAAGAGRFTAPGWVRDANGVLRRETIHHMGRRLPDFDYKGVRPDNIVELARAAAKVDGRKDEALGVFRLGGIRVWVGLSTPGR